MRTINYKGRECQVIYRNCPQTGRTMVDLADARSGEVIETATSEKTNLPLPEKVTLVKNKQLTEILKEAGYIESYHGHVEREGEQMRICKLA